MGGLIGGLLGVLGSTVSGLFSFKNKQSEVVSDFVKLAGELSDDNAKLEMAKAAVIVSENAAGGMSAKWRPFLMLVFAAIILSAWFGYLPPNINDPMGPMLARIFDLMELGIGGYIGGRSLEKIFKTLGANKTIRAFIEKKLL